MTYIGPTDGNLYALRQREREIEEYEARFTDCSDCGGAGVVSVQLNGFRTDDPLADYDEEECETCDGTGQVEQDD